MQTVIQEFRQRFLIRYPHHGEDMTDEMRQMKEWIMQEIDLVMLPREEDQIKAAYEIGEEDGYWHPENGYNKKFQNAEDYFNQTYRDDTSK